MYFIKCRKNFSYDLTPIYLNKFVCGTIMILVSQRLRKTGIHFFRFGIKMRVNHSCSLTVCTYVLKLCLWCLRLCFRSKRLSMNIYISYMLVGFEKENQCEPFPWGVLLFTQKCLLIESLRSQSCISTSLTRRIAELILMFCRLLYSLVWSTERCSVPSPRGPSQSRPRVYHMTN